MAAAENEAASLCYYSRAKTSFIVNSLSDQRYTHSKSDYIEWADTVRERPDGELNPEVFTDAVLLGGFNRSSQHLDTGDVTWER